RARRMSLVWRMMGMMTVLLAVSLPFSSAMAQTAPVKLPGSADASRLMLEHKPRAAFPENAPLTDRVPDTAATIPDHADQTYFTLRTLNIEGVTAYASESLMPLWQDKLHQQISIGDLFRIVNAITLRYRNDGYLLAMAYLPQQEITQG